MLRALLACRDLRSCDQIVSKAGRNGLRSIFSAPTVRASAQDKGQGQDDPLRSSQESTQKAGSQVGDAAKRAKDVASEKLHQAEQAVKDTAQWAKEGVSKMMGQASDAAQGAAGRVKEGAGKLKEGATEQMRQAGATAERVVNMDDGSKPIIEEMKDKAREQKEKAREDQAKREFDREQGPTHGSA